MTRVISLMMNDAAARVLRVMDGLADVAPPGGLAPGLQERVATGIVRQGEVLVWANSTGDAQDAPSNFPDLTGWECADSSLHLDGLVPVEVAVVDGMPTITEEDQGTLLRHGIALGLALSPSIYALQPPAAVRFVLAASQTNSTFRFHQIRANERWNDPNLDNYRLEKVIVMDLEPAS
jgi:hypothetical protein